MPLCGVLRSTFPRPAEPVTVPTQQGVWLNDQKSLFPVAYSSRKQDEEQLIFLGANRSFDLAGENEKLLTEQRIFRNQLRLAPSQISNGGEE